MLAYADGSEQRVRGAGGEIARFDAVRRVTVTPEWPAGAPTELNLWAHRVTAEDESEPLAAHIEPGPSAESSVTIVLGQPASSSA